MHNTTNNGFSRVKEIVKLSVIFVIVFVGSLVFTNAKLFLQSFEDTFDLGDTTPVIQVNTRDTYTDNKISTMVYEDEKKMKEIDAMIDTYTSPVAEQSVSPSMEALLQNKLETYMMDFNTLPPTNRLIVSSIGIDVPLVDSIYKDVADFSQGDFKEELMQGVVKYPTTPEPGQEGNTLFFGHTSQEFREKNPYGTVFSKLPKLQPGDVIQIVWEGQLYEYKVLTTVIKIPKQVNTEYMKYQQAGKQFVTLMGCYPLGRTDKRMMVIAERVNK